MILKFNKVTIIVGHFGAGKTNLAVNIALSLTNCTIVDLDIVNPYFRSADFADLFAERNVKLVAPLYANSALELPSLTFGMDSLFNDDSRNYVIDVGGNDEGATVLGRYSHLFENFEPDLLYVVNKYRYLTRTAEQAAECLREIEFSSKMKCTGIVNASNLGRETTAQTVIDSMDYAREVADACKLPLLFTVAKRGLFPEDSSDIFPVDIYVAKDLVH